MIDGNGQPVSKQALAGYLTIYNQGARHSKEFGTLPRALIVICDNLALGKTTYVKCKDGQVQLSRRKDGSIGSSL